MLNVVASMKNGLIISDGNVPPTLRGHMMTAEQTCAEENCEMHLKGSKWTMGPPFFLNFQHAGSTL